MLALDSPTQGISEPRLEKSEPRMRIIHYVFLGEKSLFVVDSISKEGCLKISIDIARCKMKASLILIYFNLKHDTML